MCTCIENFKWNVKKYVWRQEIKSRPQGVNIKSWVCKISTNTHQKLPWTWKIQLSLKKKKIVKYTSIHSMCLCGKYRHVCVAHLWFVGFIDAQGDLIFLCIYASRPARWKRNVSCIILDLLLHLFAHNFVCTGINFMFVKQLEMPACSYTMWCMK